MSGTKKASLMIMGALTALLLVMQLVMGQLIHNGKREPSFVTAHRHTGYTAVGLSLVYVLYSMSCLVAVPEKPKSVDGH